MSFSGDGPIVDATTPEALVQADFARPLKVWTVFAVFLAAALAATAAQIPVIIVMAFAKVAEGGRPESVLESIGTPWGFIAVALPAQLGILATWWLAISFGDPRARVFRAIGQTSLAPLAYPCFALASLGVLWLGGLLGEGAMWLLGDSESNLFATLFKSMTWPTGIVFVLFIALVPAFVEEFFFRGYMQRRLLARWSPAVAIPVVALIFAGFHGSPVWALSVLPLGFWLGILAWRTGSLWPGIVCHAFVNGSVNLGRVLVALGVIEDAPPSVYYVGIGTALALLALSAWILIRYRRHPAAARPAGEGANGLEALQ